MRLAPSSRPRPGGLIHIESPPWILDGVRLDWSCDAVCDTGIADLDARWIGARTEATCRRCRHIVRQLPRDARMVWPLWCPERALGRDVPPQAEGWEP